MQPCRMVFTDGHQFLNCGFRLFVFNYLKNVVLPFVFQVYRITSICLGTPPKTFDWEYFDKSKTYCKLSGVTPLQFYNEHIKPVYNPLDKVTIFFSFFFFLWGGGGGGRQSGLVVRVLVNLPSAWPLMKPLLQLQLY